MAAAAMKSRPLMMMAAAAFIVLAITALVRTLLTSDKSPPVLPRLWPADDVVINKCDLRDMFDVMRHAGPDGDPKCLAGISNFLEMEVITGKQTVPDPFQSVVLEWLGHSDDLYTKFLSQSVLQVFNRFTRTTTVFNPLRASRPLPKTDKDPAEYVREISDATAPTCQLCQYRDLTATDAIGRIESPHVMTASNAFKLSDFHALVMPRQHDPLELTQDILAEVMDVATKWFDLVREQSASHTHPLLIYDSMPHAGVSQIHPHFHLFMGEGHYLGQFRELSLASEAYGNDFAYITDYVQAHVLLGLGVRVGEAVVISPLDARKDHEFVIVSARPNADYVNAFHTVYRTYLDELGVFCWSSASAWPPRKDDPHALPVVTRIASRGNCQAMMSDVSSLELYMFDNINSNPYKTIQAFERTLTKIREKKWG